MAMLRVSSYRKLFEDDRWSPSGGSRRAAVDRSVCDKLDFVATRALNKEGLDRFAQERTTIAALNDRLVKLIELVWTDTYLNDSAVFYSLYFSAVLLRCLLPSGPLFGGRE
ncbi:hypothetical protein XENOCAPTIV_030614 [Xenoophorus captivus]|uniref:Uncharacterized protein n=1 Tax=Xenoophorus captivus TaxID=1517983 RepID=A0ABV0Q720_9TELE